MIVMNLNTVKVVAKHELLFNKQRWVSCISKLDLRSTTKCDQNDISNICKFGHT